VRKVARNDSPPDIEAKDEPTNEPASDKTTSEAETGMKTGMETGMKAGRKTEQKIIEMLSEAPGTSITAISVVLGMTRSSIIGVLEVYSGQAEAKR